MNKRGISSIVATVLIILITVAAISMIWVFVLPMIKENVSIDTRADLSISTEGGYSVYDSSNHSICLQIDRGTDNTNLIAIEFIFSIEGDTSTVTLPTELKTNQKKTYCFDNVSGNLESVSIAPVIVQGTTKKVGAVISQLNDLPKGDLSSFNADYYDLGLAGNSTECVPNCESEGKVCGSDGCGGSCGTCENGACQNGSCVEQCLSEDNSTFCSRFNASCSLTAQDNCGNSRTVNCGTCDSGQTCEDGNCIVCVPQCANPYAIACGRKINSTNHCGTCPSGNLCSAGTLCNGTSCVSVNAPEGLIAYWSGNGNANDVFGVNNGYWVGSPGYVTGMVGQAFNLSGGRYIITTDTNLPSGNSNRTISFWFKTSADNQLIIHYGYYYWGQNFDIATARGDMGDPDWSGGHLVFGTYGQTIGTNINTLTDNQWHFGTITYSGDNVIKIYVDGILDKTSGTGVGTSLNGALTIGGRDNSLLSLDELMIFNRTLGATEISDMYGNYF